MPYRYAEFWKPEYTQWLQVNRALLSKITDWLLTCWVGWIVSQHTEVNKCLPALLNIYGFNVIETKIANDPVTSLQLIGFYKDNNKPHIDKRSIHLAASADSS